MLFTIISLVLFLIMLLIAIKIGIKKEKSDEDEGDGPVIHASGIYSIVRKSPFDDISSSKPTDEEIRKYLSSINEDMKKVPLSKGEKDHLFSHWNESLKQNIQEIETGDKVGVEFYYYDFPEECAGCDPYVSKGQFVTREEIYQFPSIIPPFHIGCTCRIHAHHGKENLKETTELGMRPLFDKGTQPPLPEWTQTLKPM